MYNRFYGFLESPFEATPDPKFLYLTPSHGDALVSIFGGITNRKGFISLTGEAGTGKTTLIHFLLDRLDDKVKTAFIFHPSITFKDFLRKIFLEIDREVVEGNDKVLLGRLNDYLLKELGEDETLAVIIDEAQHLPQKVMQELGRVRETIPRVPNRLQIIFVGQPEFEARLNSPGLRHLNQSIEIKCQIKPLTQEESRDYIDHRLKLVESSGSEVFTQNAISMIIHHAQGIPRVINILCDNALLRGYSLCKLKIDADIIREVLKELEGPTPQKSIPMKIVTMVERFRSVPISFNFSQKRILVTILSLLCLGGLIVFALIYGPLHQRPVNTWTIESIMKPPMGAEIASNRTFPQTTTGPPKSSQPPVKHDSLSQDFRQSLSPSSTPPSPDLLEGVIAAEKGETISSLAQKYYHMANPTLVNFILDFNPEIDNAHLIQINQRIRIPKIRKEWLIRTSPDGTSQIHVGTFWAPDFVRPYKEEPALKGKEIAIIPRKISPQDTWYRVMIRSFDHKEDALKMIDLLKEKGLLPLFGGTPKRK